MISVAMLKWFPSAHKVNVNEHFVGFTHFFDILIYTFDCFFFVIDGNCTELSLCIFVEFTIRIFLEPILRLGKLPQKAYGTKCDDRVGS